MPAETQSRRDVLRRIASLWVATGGAALDSDAAQHVHAAAAEEKAATGAYRARFFQPHQWTTLRRLAELIVPADEHSGSAADAGAVEFIDLLCSQNERLAEIYSGGLAWLDAEMRSREGKPFVECAEARQIALLDALVEAQRAEERRREETRSYRRSEDYKPFSDYGVARPDRLAPGVRFFDWMRRMVVDAFYTSPLGVKDLDFRGNRAYSEYKVPGEAIDYALRRSPFRVV